MGRRKKQTSQDEPELVNDKMYFTEATENAIVRYNEATDPDVREYIFRASIAKPLDKLAENVINRFKFPYVNQSFDDTKRQVVSFLVINLSKFRGERGKAFSYFSVIAKNYLILHNTNGYKEEKRSLYLSDAGDDYVPLDEIVGSLEAPDDRVHDDTKEFVALMIKYWEDNLTRVFKKKRDIAIATAVVELFRRAETLENFNKKALYLLIREMTDCKTAYITKVVKKMRLHTAKQLEEFYDKGTVNGDDPKYFKYE